YTSALRPAVLAIPGDAEIPTSGRTSEIRYVERAAIIVYQPDQMIARNIRCGVVGDLQVRAHLVVTACRVGVNNLGQLALQRRGSSCGAVVITCRWVVGIAQRHASERAKNCEYRSGR